MFQMLSAEDIKSGTEIQITGSTKKILDTNCTQRV